METVITDNEAPAAASEPTVGQKLRAAREAQGRSIADVAAVLKLGARQLEALEHSDWSALPGTTFVKGFIRNYARLLGLPAELLLAGLDASLNVPVDVLHVPASAHTPVSYSTGSSVNKRVVLWGVFALLLAGILFALGPDELGKLKAELEVTVQRLTQRGNPPATPATETAGSTATGNMATAPAAVSAVAPVDPVLPPGTTPAQVLRPQALMPVDAPVATVSPIATGAAAPLEFQVDKASWIEVKDRDGKLLLSQKLDAGARPKVAGDGPLTVVIGYAPGVRLSWRGQNVDLEPHTRGDVARLVLE